MDSEKSESGFGFRLTRCEVVNWWQKRLLADLLSDSDGVGLHLVLRRSDLASHFTQPVRRCQSGWMFVTRGACRSRRSSAGRLLISRRYRSGAGGSLLDCYFLVVTREGWTPQPRTARNPVMTGGADLSRLSVVTANSWAADVRSSVWRGCSILYEFSVAV